jgi:hypothetical protein
VRLKLARCDNAASSSQDVLPLLRQRRVVAGSGLGTGPGTKLERVRHTTSGAAGNGLGTTIKFLRRTRNGAADSSFGTTIKYL